MFNREAATALAAELFKPFETCELEAYLCPAGVWTIGWGHTGPDVHPGLVISQDEADSLLVIDLHKAVEGVDAVIKVDLSPRQAGALISLTYNIGVEAFRDSTLLKLLNIGNYDGAALQFARWNKSKGKVLNGLIRRRAAEAKMFVEG